MNKGISVITSFGCPYDCWYCIMKQHRLHDYKGNFDFNKLSDFLKENKDTSGLSISGGGDPLNNFINNKYFYFNFLFPTVDCLKMCGIDIYTRIPLKSYEFWSHINMCVFSIDFVNGDIINKDFIIWVSKI